MNPPLRSPRTARARSFLRSGLGRLATTLGFAASCSFAGPSLASGPEELRDVIADLEARGYTVGVAVLDVETGRSVYEHGADRSLKPASTSKLVTTCAALELLGPTAELATEFRLGGAVQEGVLEGDLWVVGFGDPGLQEGWSGGEIGARLDQLAAKLRAAGVQRVRGGVVHDGRFFAGEGSHPEWPREDRDQWYCAPVTALSVGGGCIRFGWEGEGSGRRPALYPSRALLGVEVVDRTSKDAKKPVWYAQWLDDPARWELRGEIPARGEIAPVLAIDPDPARTVAAVVRAGLAARGIAFEGGITAAAAVTPAGEPLARWGTGVAEIVYFANKESLNHASACLWKHVGARFGGEGSWAGGARAALVALERLGVGEAARKNFAFVDGSGLSHANRGSARLLAETLLRARERAWWPALELSLPRAGQDGTLARRMRDPELRDRVRAKTGWIAGASALSGTVRTQEGRSLVFAILVEYDRKLSGVNSSIVKPAQDRFVSLLVHGAAGGPR